MQCHDLSGGRFGYLAQRHIGDQGKLNLHSMTKASRYVVECAPHDKRCRQQQQEAAAVKSGVSVTDSFVCGTHSHGRLTTSQDPKNMLWNTSMLGRQFLRYECTGCDYIAEYVWKPLKYMGAPMMYGMLLFTISLINTEIHGKSAKNSVFALKMVKNSLRTTPGDMGDMVFFYGPHVA